MKKLLQLLRVKREEWLSAAIALVVLIGLHTCIIAKFFKLFTHTGTGHWNVFVKNFTISGFDPITYSMVTYWEANYNVYRHPLLSFMVWPLSMLNKWCMSTFDVNLVQFIVAVPLLVCGFYAYIFLYRTLREVVQLRRFDATLLSALFFSFGYILVTLIVPDHFCISMCLLLLSVYLAGRKMQQGKPFTVKQTWLLFFITAGVTLSNGIKTFLYALFTNGKQFFKLKYFLSAVILPSALIWGFARWEYHTFVWPHEMARHTQKAKKAAAEKQKNFQAFADTVGIKDTTELKKAFDTEMKKRAKAKYKADHKQPWNKHTGKPMGNGEFMRWTDETTSRTQTAIENLFGESIQLHKDHLLEDTLRSRPVIVRYNWAVSYVLEGLAVVLFLLGVWCGRRSRFLWMVLSGFAFDMLLHMGLGFGINEVYIMAAHWLFALPIAMAYLVKQVQTTKWATGLRCLLLLLTLYLWIYNGTLLVGYLVG